MVPDLTSGTGAGLSPDAAIALGIASTAMPFARSPEEQAERWLRILQVHGEAGVVLKALGVGEASTEDLARSDLAEEQPSERGNVVAEVAELAGRIARGRGAATVGTVDLLVAAMQVYGPVFDRLLEAHGTSRRQVADRLDRPTRT